MFMNPRQKMMLKDGRAPKVEKNGGFEMRYRDTESGKIYDEIELLLDNAESIRESSGARNFAEWLRNATDKNGFLEVVK